MLERMFGIARAGSTVRREIVAGLTTFATLSYILFVQPAVLSNPVCGMDAGAVLFATCVASALACFAMAWWANLPLALAPAMGHNVFFAFTVCGAMGLAWPEALAANFVAGVVFLLLSFTRFRERVMDAVPTHLKHAIGAGIGLLIATIGLEWAGIVIDHPATFVTLGDLSSPIALLAVFGIALNAVLLAWRVPGAFLLGILGSAFAGFAASRVFGIAPALVQPDILIGQLPSPTPTAFRLDLGALFARPLWDWLAIVLVFFVLDLFDSVGTLIGVASKAGLVKDGRLPRVGGAFAADAVGTVAGALLGTSTVTSYVESAAGVAVGGRTGLVAVVVGLCMLAALALTPVVQVIGGGVAVSTGGVTTLYYPVVAPVLVLIGALMLGSLRHVEWDDARESIPAFLTIVVMQLSVSITEGLAWGFIATALLDLATRRRTSPIVAGIALLFVLRYILL